MTSLKVRAAVPEDLEAILALTAEDSMHYYEEPATITEQQRAAFNEISSDAHEDLVVRELDGRIVCTAQLTWMRMLSADGASYYEELGYTASHIGMKKYLT